MKWKNGMQEKLLISITQKKLTYLGAIKMLITPILHN